MSGWNRVLRYTVTILKIATKRQSTHRPTLTTNRAVKCAESQMAHCAVSGANGTAGATMWKDRRMGFPSNTQIFPYNSHFVCFGRIFNWNGHELIACYQASVCGTWLVRTMSHRTVNLLGVRHTTTKLQIMLLKNLLFIISNGYK